MDQSHRRAERRQDTGNVHRLSRSGDNGFGGAVYRTKSKAGEAHRALNRRREANTEDHTSLLDEVCPLSCPSTSITARKRLCPVERHYCRFFAFLSLLLPILGALAEFGIEFALAHTDVLRGAFQQIVRADIFERLIKTHIERTGQTDRYIGVGGAHIR